MSQYSERVDAVLEAEAASLLGSKDFVTLASAALDQAGITVRAYAEACAKASRRPSKTHKWPEYMQAVLEELGLKEPAR